MSQNNKQPLGIGNKAPAFSLKTTPDQQVSLSDFKGQTVILAFYPADFSPVCNDQLGVYNQILPMFRKHNAAILGISVDNVWSHLSFAKERNLHFPLLSDFHPKGRVAEEYGVYLEEYGEAGRGLFVIDGDGIIRWSYLAPIGINPGAEGILEALEEMQEKAVHP